MIWVPSELAYGDTARGKFIAPGSVLCFEMELLKVNGPSKKKPVRPSSEMSDVQKVQPEAKSSSTAEDGRESSRSKRPKPSAHALSLDAEPLAQLPKPKEPQPIASTPPNPEAENSAPQALAAASSAPAPKKPDSTPEEMQATSFDAGVDTVLEAMSTLLGKLQVPTLQQALSDLGLPTTGAKEELTERLTGALPV